MKEAIQAKSLHEIAVSDTEIRCANDNSGHGYAISLLNTFSNAHEKG